MLFTASVPPNQSAVNWWVQSTTDWGYDPGAAVVATNVATVAELRSFVFTGQYRLGNLAAGVYALRVNATVFQALN